MARRRFFVEEVRNGGAELLGDDAQHLTRVLRVEVGQRYEISDNRSVYLAEIETARKSLVSFRLIEKIPMRDEGLRVTLCAALFKFDRFEWLMEKATELGVHTIVPFTATRTERGLDRAAEKRVERWRRIALEASQQSRRDHLPIVDDPVDLDEILRRTADRPLLLDEEAVGLPLTASTEPVMLALGPEGGWTGEERERFHVAGWRSVSLGPQILRAETAGIAALSVLRCA